MTGYYKVEKSKDQHNVVELSIGFGQPAQQPEILQDALQLIRDMNLPGGKLIKFNGPCSVPVAMALAHEVAHLYGAVACFDPKLAAYVVCISHDPAFPIGQLLD